MSYPLWSEKTRVFIDTSSLMSDGVDVFVRNHLMPVIHLSKAVFVVAKRVLDELDKHILIGDLTAADMAKKAKRILDNIRGGYIVAGDNDDDFVDNLFQTVFVRLRLRYRLILITQDRKLAYDVLNLNNSSSVEGICGIDVYRIGDRGEPMKWCLDDSCRDGVRYNKPNDKDGFSTIGIVMDKGHLVPFGVCSVPVALDEALLEPRVLPGEGDVVYDDRHFSYELVSVLGAGGEGVAYMTNQGLVCKIYRQNMCKRFLFEKIDLMTSRRVEHANICWPVSVAFNQFREPVGYLMPLARGIELKRALFIKPLLVRRFPNWNRSNIVSVLLSFLRSVEFLHSINVLLGDINARNILIDDEGDVFLVDCDSYQVEAFPCPVGMPPYLAPELYGESLRSVLRTFEHDYFAVATMVFMLLHPGKPPYSHQGGEDPSQNVRKQHFPYSRGGQRADGVPDGPWRYMWSHLPRYMKDAFHEVFSDGERLTVENWISLLERYDNDLRKEYVSSEIFPTSLKQLNRYQVEQQGREWKTCVMCGEGFDAFQPYHTKCRECMRVIRMRDLSGNVNSYDASALSGGVGYDSIKIPLSSSVDSGSSSTTQVETERQNVIAQFQRLFGDFFS